MKSTAGRAIAELLRSIFVQLVELDKTAPGDCDEIVRTTVEHLRAWRPVSVAPLGVLPPPTEIIRDPRSPA